MSNSSPTIDHGHLQNKKYSDDQRGTASKFTYRRQECVTRQHLRKSAAELRFPVVMTEH